MTKNEIMLQEIVFRYHPRFKKSKSGSAALRRIGIERPAIFNIERLIEESMAFTGELLYVDADGYDFLPDHSDSKTVTLTVLKNKVSCRGTIGSVGAKVGALRVVAFNAMHNCLDFFYIPHEYIKKLKFRHTKVSEGIALYFGKNGYYNLEEYRVDSFEELARAR